MKARWNKTPATLHKCFPNVSAECWRCLFDVGDMLHIWWTCPLIQTYWVRVHKIICKVTGYQLEFSPALYLLQLPPANTKISNTALSIQLIIAARMCILVHWKSSTTPALEELLRKVDKRQMEELILITQDKYDRFYETWAVWIHFRNAVGTPTPSSLV